MLETFAILFDMNDDQAVTDLKKVEQAVDKTEKKLNDAEKATGKFKGSLLGAFATLAGGVTALFTVGTALSAFNSAIDYADKIGETAEAIGVSTENLSAWSDAAAISGGSADGLQSSVRNLSKDLYQFAETGNSRAAPFLKSFGISLKDVNGKARDVFDVLPDIAQAMEGMSKQEAIGFGQKIGLDNGTIMMLQQGKAGLDELIKRQKSLGTVSKEDAEMAAKFKDSLEDMGKTLRPIFLGIANLILPAFTWVLEKLQKLTAFIKDHKIFFLSAIGAIAGALTVLYLPAMIKAGIATWTAMAPIIAMAAVLLALGAVIALVVEDIYAFMTGNESLLGQLAQKWPWIGKYLNYLKEGFILLFGVADKVMTFFVNMWNDPKKTLKEFGDMLSNVWNDFIDSVPGLRKILDTIVAIFNTAIGGIKATIEAVTNSITTAKDLLTGTNSKAEKAGKEAVQETERVSPEEAKRRVDARVEKLRLMNEQTASLQRINNNNIANTNSNRTNTVTATNNNTINITTGADPQEVKKVIQDELSAQTKTAIQQVDDGVSH